MLKLETKTDLERLISEGIPESLSLEYKGSRSLAKDSRPRDELCKDVSALANSAGGQIVYGIEEDGHVPVRIDDGADPSITKEWVEQVLDSRIQPRIDGLLIAPIKLNVGFGFVVTVPQATSRAPHQAPDKKYYKRQNFQSVPMEDYEIRDALRRATTPVLEVALSIGQNNAHRLEFPAQQKYSKPFTVNVAISNSSPQPAYYTVLYIGVSVDFALPAVGLDRANPPPGHEAKKRNWFIRRFNSPPEQPIFQEAAPNAIGFSLLLEDKFARNSFLDLTTLVQTPGFRATDHWVIACNAGLLKLHGPNDPNWMPSD